ncbi:MAG: FAD-dependent oxidoreductase [Gemmatimonadota bacterium]
MPSTSSNESLWAGVQRVQYPTLVGEAFADVCVVGLGGSGLVCAGELLRLGASVIGIDAGAIGGGAGGRNGGFLLAGVAKFYHDAIDAYGRERARQMYQLSLDEIERIAAATPDTVSLCGSLRIADSPEEERDCLAQVVAMRRDGLAAEAYDGAEGRGVLVPGDGAFQPLERCASLAAAVRAAGGVLFEGSPVTRVAAGAVHTPTGVVRAKRVVVAVDGALDLLLPELASEVRTARLQMLATAPTTEISLTRPVYTRWGYDYWQQRPDGAIALGGARDVGGDAEWTHDTSPTETVQRALDDRLRATLGVSAKITHRWGASVSYTKSEVPIVREVRPSVWAVGGYSGTGNVIGSLLGRGIARLVIRGDDALLSPFLHA